MSPDKENKMAIDEALLDQLIAGYQKPDDLIGENGLLKQLTKRLIELILPTIGGHPVKRVYSTIEVSNDDKSKDKHIPKSLFKRVQNRGAGFRRNDRHCRCCQVGNWD